MRFYVIRNRIWALYKKAKLSHREAVSAMKRAGKFAQGLLRPDATQRPLMMNFIKRIVVHADRIGIEISRAGLLKQLSLGDAAPSCVKQVDRPIALTTACQFRWRGGEMRLVIGDQSDGEGAPDLTLIAAVVRARAWWGELAAGNVSSIKQIADREHSDVTWLAS